MAKKEENEENICHWNACGTQFETAESLFNHVCSNHIGRKSAGTLSLECKWTGCHAKASKRDHLTSHCRVHIALKPHVCTVCTKAFKRPQDLKKHEKIHSEDHHTTYKSHKAAVAAQQANEAAAAAAAAQAAVQGGYPFLGAPQTLDAKGQPIAPQLAYPFASIPGFPYPYAFLPGQSLPGQMPGALAPASNPNDQFAQLIALQTHLNAQAAQANNPAAAFNMSGLGLAGLPGGAPGGQFGAAQFPASLSAQAAALNAQAALQLFPQAAAGVFPYGNAAFTFSAPGQAQSQYAMAGQSQQQHAQQQQHRSNGLTMTPPSTSSPLQPASLYPQLPTSLYPTPASFLPALPSSQPPPSSQQAHSAVKGEGDLPSPAHSARSAHHSPYSSSLSPSNVPALSPPSLSTPENSFSPSPRLEDDFQRHQRSLSSSGVGGAVLPPAALQVAGKKRAFDEAAGSFLGDLQNKRFQDADSMAAQLDVLSSFLLTPEMSATAALTPGEALGLHHGAAGSNGGGDDSASSAGGSDYGASTTGANSFDREEVDTINQLLLTLNQSLDDPAAAAAAGSANASSTSTPGAIPPHHHHHHHHNPHTLDLHSSFPDLAAAGAHSHSSTASPADGGIQVAHPRPIASLPASAVSSFASSPASSGSLYPSLPGSLASSTSSLAARSTPQQQQQQQMPAYPSLYGYPHANGLFPHQHQPQQDLLRLSKTPAAPTIANDYRATQYQHVARLQRAAPSTEHDDEMDVDAALADADVDDDVKDAAAALLMGRGYSATAIRAAADSKPKLPSLATALAAGSSNQAGPRLAPILPAGAATRLPPIRDLLSHQTSEAPPESPTSPVASSSSSASPFAFPSSSSSSTTPSASSSSLYPSLSSVAPTCSSRPVSAGGVERLTHRVHKLRLPSTNSVTESDETTPPLGPGSSILEDAADLSATSDEESEDDDDEERARGEDGRGQRKGSSSRHKDKKFRVESPEPILLEHVKPEPVDDDDDELEDVKPDIKSDEEEESRLLEQQQRLRQQEEVVARRRATLMYLAMYVNAQFRAGLAKKGVKEMRRAIKSNPHGAGAGAGVGGAGPSGLKQEVKPEGVEAA
ncbi:hypothetical protein JCM11251_000683 [Rhodosporidiobolus azoricus]